LAELSETARVGNLLSGNLFLERLPKAASELLSDAGTLVDLKVREPLFDAGQRIEYVWFPLDGVISNVITMASGAVVEVGVVGREGVAGYTASLTAGASASSLYAQISGRALKVSRADLLAAIEASGTELFAAYTESQIASLSWYAGCNRLHKTDQRFARWLLMAHDRMPADDIPLTQEFLALMLGVRRPGVTVAAMSLQRRGIITYRRGRIAVLDRAALLALACECYASVERRFAGLLGYSIRKDSD